MDILKKELTKFFETNTDLKFFKPFYEKLIKNISIDFSKYPPSKERYQRYVLYCNETFEIVLISWGKDIKTKNHCHPENGCLLGVLKGKLLEHRSTHQDKIYSTQTLNLNEIGYMHCDLGVHQVININNDVSYSLHIYSPPGFYNNN